MTLGELLASMGPGAPGGMPQMAPPPGIPWEQPQAPVAPPPQMRSPNAGMNPAQAQVPQPRPAAPAGGYSTPQAGQDIMSAFAAFLQENRDRWAEEDRNTAEDARGAENTPAKPVKSGLEPSPADVYGMDPFADIGAPSTPPAAAPARSNADLQGYSPQTEPLSMFDVYGAPTPTKRPLDFGSMLFSDNVPPMPERAPGQAQPVPAQQGAPAGSPPAKAPVAQASSRGGSAEGATSSGTRASGVPPFQNAPNTDDPFPQSSPLFDTNTGRFLLQTGLNLMVPSWGGPLAQIGSAVGAGAEAVGRGQETDQKTKMSNAKLQLEQQRVNKMGLGRKGASESSGSKRLKEKTPMQQFAAGLSPEGTMFFQTRMKQLNKMAAPDEEGNTPDAASSFDQIMAETKRVDSRARMGRGQLKSEEIPDSDIAKAVATPALEQQMLNWVAADPVQRQLTFTRIQNAKAAASGGTSTKPNG